MKLFRDVLQATGYRTLEATTGERAVELALEHRPTSCSWTSSSRTSTASRRSAGCAPTSGSASMPVAGADGPGDGGRPRALPGRRLRRLPLQAGGHRRVRRHREALLRGKAVDERRRRQDPRRRRRSRERAPARGRARAARLRRRLGRRRPGLRSSSPSSAQAGSRPARRDDAAARRLRRLPGGCARTRRRRCCR